MKWTTETKYVDLETGRLLSKREIQEEEYYVVRTKTTKTIKNKQNGNKQGIIELTNECRKCERKQGTIF